MIDLPSLRALVLALIAGLSTLLGALAVFTTRRRSQGLLAVSLGFAAGVMLSVSFTDLFPNARELLSVAFGTRPGAVLSVAALAGGILLALAFDQATGEAPHKNLLRVGVVSTLAIALHNLPEGMATFMAGYEDATLGLTIAFAIAMHNIPEGITVAMPIWYATGSRRRAFRYTLLSALAEPAGAGLAFLVLRPFISDMLLGSLFGVVSGIMIYIAVEELIPSSRQYGHDRSALWATFAGICLMPLTHLF